MFSSTSTRPTSSSDDGPVAPHVGPVVSIIINNHNYAAFVGKAITSALNQTYDNCEVIVVDDGSTDRSREVIESFASRITCVFKHNGGQASALNAGFSASRGMIVCFLDSDDALEPEAIECVVRSCSPGVGKVQFSLRFMDEDGSSLPQVFPDPTGPLPNGDFSRAILEGGIANTPPMSGNAFSRWALEQLMPIPEAEWRIGADAYLLVVTPLFGSIVSLPRVLGRYRVRQRLWWQRGRPRRAPRGSGPRHALEDGAPASVPVSAWGAESVLRILDHEGKKVAALRAVAHRRGLTVSDRWPLRNSTYVDYRLYMLVHHAVRHPFPGDARRALAWYGFIAVHRARRSGVKQLLLSSAYYGAVALTPPSVARLLTKWRVRPDTRPPTFGKLLARLCRETVRWTRAPDTAG